MEKVENKMDRKNTMKAISIVAAVLLFVASLSALMSTSTIANASISSLSSRINPETGEPYGDLMQYDWPLPGHDSGNTGFNPGPAPNRPDVLWTRSGVSGGPPVAFNNSIFTYGGGRLLRLDPFTGYEIWNVPINGTPIGFGCGQLWKIDEQHMGHMNSDGISIYRIADGSLVTRFRVNATIHGIVASVAAGEVYYWGGHYYYEGKIAYFATRNATTNQFVAVALDCSNPTAGVTIKWVTPLPTGVEALGAGDGMVFYGGYGEGEIFALNATTGDIVWRNWKVGDAGYRLAYYNGKIYHSAGGTKITCYDGKTGEKLWETECGPRNFMAFGGALGYGMYFDANIAIPGYIGAWSLENGELLWRQPAHFSISYGTPAVADGKLFVQTCDQASGSVAGVPTPGSSFTCFDAYTGQVIWKLPINIALPMIAYGNLYGISGGVLYCIGEKTGEWPMFHGVPSNNGVAVGQNAPADLSSPAWKFKADGPIVGSPVAKDGKIVFGSYDGNIYCVDAKTGSLQWKFPTGYRVASTPAFVGNVVYTGADDGYIYAINASNGQQIWKKFAGGVTIGAIFRSMPQVRSSPVVVGDRLYVGSMDGNIYCLDTANGNIVWKYPATNMSYGIGSTPYIYKGVLYIGAGNGVLYALNAATGALVWNITLTASDRRLVASPIVVNDTRGGEMLIIGSDTGAFMGGRRMFFIDINNGSTLFYVDLTLVGSASVIMAWRPAYRYNGSHGILYISEGMFVSSWAIVNRTYANRTWSQWVGHVVYSTGVYADAVAYRGGLLYVGNNAYSMKCFNATSGVPISSYSTNGPIFGSAAIYDGNLYFGSYDGYLYCFTEKKVAETDIVAWSDRNKCNVNETIVIQGKLRAKTIYDFSRFNPYVPAEAFNTEVWYPGIPNAPVKVTFVKPDGSTEDVTAKTDNKGLFTVSYTPKVSGNWAWTAWYEGEDRIALVYDSTYGDTNSLEVVAPTSPPPPPPQQEQPTGLPMELIAAAIIIIIAIIAAAAYILIKRKK